MACKDIDPAWLTGNHQEEHFTDGPETWPVFGAKGVELLPHPQRAEARVLAIRKLEKGMACLTPCYLRLRAIESNTQDGGCLIEWVVADTTPAARP